jgi:signal transduction histidine kinase
LYTDGVEESRNQQQEMFGEERLKAAFDGGGDDKFNRIISALENFTLGVEQDDDITLAELNCQPNIDYRLTANNTQLNTALIPWQLNVTLSPEDMRQAEPVPQIIRLLGNATGLNVHEDFISTILSEFYGNALEHGLLGLDSAIKDEEDGFFTYYQLRRERLATLTQGEITIRLDFSPRDNGVITLCVSDSGDGFEQSSRSANAEQSFGRGINIARHLCESVEYSNGGSTVTAVYHIGASR